MGRPQPIGGGGANRLPPFLESGWTGGSAGADPSLFPNTVPNGPAGQLCIQLKARGPCTSFFEAGTAGESAIAFARDAIVSGSADVMLVCGVDERSMPLVVIEAHFARATRETDARGLLRPYGHRRTGSVFGDAVGAIVLESEQHAASRGGPIRAILEPVVAGGEATPPGRWPSRPAVLARVLRGALGRACICADEVGLVNAAACGSPRFDALEAAALTEALGPRGGGIPVTAPKALTGDGSASGVFRTVVSVLALAHDMRPGTARTEEVDPTVDLEVTVGPATSGLQSDRILHVGSGPGGTHAAFVLSGYA